VLYLATPETLLSIPILLLVVILTYNSLIHRLLRHLRYSENLKSPVTWTKTHQKKLVEFSKCLDEEVLEDPMFKLREAAYEELGRSMANIEVERYYPFKHHPLLCGSLALGIKLVLQEIGLTLCLTWGQSTPGEKYFVS
jgi:hypothetical protein